MSFSPEWLSLREPVDHASRSPELAERVRAHFAGRPNVRVVDFGCGTGSNLRAAASLLPPVQEWVLVDYDPALLRAAEQRLTIWADTVRQTVNGLKLIKGQTHLTVHFRRLDLNAQLDEALGDAPDLVTASALFDLVSETWIVDFARRLRQKGAAFYTVLTYDGRDAFAPAHPLDQAVIAAFCAHQGSDKGFGPAAGPRGADALEAAFRAAGYSVSEAESPWRIDRKDANLASQLIDGIARAVSETNTIEPAKLAGWLDFRRQRLTQPDALLVTGHRDTFAIPHEQRRLPA